MLSEVVEWEVRLRPRKEGSMSILIKGMQMPQNCYECRFGKEKQFDFGIVCTLLNGTTLDTTSRPKGICPLIEIPPHGRLIIGDGEIVNE